MSTNYHYQCTIAHCFMKESTNTRIIQAGADFTSTQIDVKMHLHHQRRTGSHICVGNFSSIDSCIEFKRIHSNCSSGVFPGYDFGKQYLLYYEHFQDFNTCGVLLSHQLLRSQPSTLFYLISQELTHFNIFSDRAKRSIKVFLVLN